MKNPYRIPRSLAAGSLIDSGLDLPLRGMKAKVKYHIPLRSTRAWVEHYAFAMLAMTVKGLLFGTK